MNHRSYTRGVELRDNRFPENRFSYTGSRDKDGDFSQRNEHSIEQCSNVFNNIGSSGIGMYRQQQQSQQSQYTQQSPPQIDQQPVSFNTDIPPLDIQELKKKSYEELLEMVKSLITLEQNIRFRKQDAIMIVLRNHANMNGVILNGGFLEVLIDGYGFLRSKESSYLSCYDDVYISPNQIKKFCLRTGDFIRGKVRLPREGEKYLAMIEIETVNGATADGTKRRPLFEALTPLFPHDRLRLERGNSTEEDITCRLIDIVAPIGKGQRGLIVSPPKAGKTTVLQRIAHAIRTNSPECYIIVLLIDERPEEVTDMIRSVDGEVIASTFDESPVRHVQVTEMVLEKAKRMVEMKHDVVILLDSITRLARAYNSVIPPSGKLLTGGLDANALQKPKKFFGSARNIEDGGSLTIIATALVDTGSKMDDIIYEEFKGTGNMELHLERHMAEKRIFPAISVLRSGTRKEELITEQQELQNMYILRRVLQSIADSDPTEFVIDKLRKTINNAMFFEMMRR